MAPLPCSPVSNTTASDSQSMPTSDDDADQFLTTPRPGPTDPAQRSAVHLSQPSLPTFPTTANTPATSESPHLTVAAADQTSPVLSPKTGPSSSTAGPQTIPDDRPPTLLPSPLPLAPSASSSSFPPPPTRHVPPASSSSSVVAVGGHPFDWPERKRSITFNSDVAGPKASRQSSYSSFAMAGGGGPRSPPVGGGSGFSSAGSSPGLGGAEFPRHHHRMLRMEAASSLASADDVAESSADENTAIMKKPGPVAGSRLGYGAVADERDERRLAEAEDSSVADLDPIGRMPSRLKKRKSGAGLKGAGNRAAVPNGPGQDLHDGEEGREGWFKALLEKYGSVELENKGSVARDHLALERTFLAWLRTSLSFASIGIAVTQLFRLNTSLESDQTHSEPYENMAKLRQVGKPLGATFLGISILILLLGFHRYFESQHYVIRGKFPASRITIMLVTFVAFGLIVASLIVIIAVAPTAFER